MGRQRQLTVYDNTEVASGTDAISCLCGSSCQGRASQPMTGRLATHASNTEVNRRILKLTHQRATPDWGGVWYLRLQLLLVIINQLSWFAFSALTLLVGRREEHLACKNRAMRFWCGYLSEAKCRLLAYSPADATAITKPDHLLPDINPDWFYLSGTGLPRLSCECSDRRIKLIMICTESSFVYGLLFYKFLSPTRVVPV